VCFARVKANHTCLQPRVNRGTKIDDDDGHYIVTPESDLTENCEYLECIECLECIKGP
jgi:hypothetical protein